MSRKYSMVSRRHLSTVIKMNNGCYGSAWLLMPINAVIIVGHHEVTHEIPSNPLEDPAIDSNLLGARCAAWSTRDLRLRGCIHELSEWKWVPCPSAGEIRWNEHSCSLDFQSSCAMIHLSLLSFDKCQDGWRCNHIEEYIMCLRWLDRVFQVNVLIPTLPMSIMVHDDQFVNPDLRWWSMTMSRTDNR